MITQNKNISKYTLIILSLILVVFRFIIPPVDVLAWDVFGYYLYLPAKFIYEDIGLTNQEWLNQLFEKYQPSGTLYQIIHLENGNCIIKYTMGMAFLYSPFFFIANFLAELLGFPADGLSLPYQYSIALGCLLYSIIGLIVLRKILKKYFDEKITTILLIIIVLGTNYFHLTAYDGTTLCHNILFTLYAILILYTIKWYDNQRMKYAIIIGIAIGLIILIRPSEMVCILIPLLWGIKNKQSIRKKIQIFRKNFSHIIVLIIFMVLIGLPQLIYWKINTGNFFFYSYTNPGEGLEFFSPNTINFLFNFRKGWFIYTPIMIFSITGFYSLYRRNKSIFFAIVIFFLADLWFISSWTAWWYAGGSFSSRSLVPAYTILSIPMGYFIEDIRKQKAIIFSFTIICILFIILNLFQTWQFRKGIISKERMTKEYYFAIFGKTSVNEEDEKLLLVERSTDSYEYFTNKDEYSKNTLCVLDFEEDKFKNPICFSGFGAFEVDEYTIYLPCVDIKYKEITKHDHAWISSSVNIFFPENCSKEFPFLVVTFHHDNKVFKYKTTTIKPCEIKYNDWNSIHVDYLTPEMRSVEDNLKIYIWNRGKANIIIDDFIVEAFEPL